MGSPCPIVLKYRLVQDQQLGVVHERLDDAGLLTHSAGVATDPTVQVQREAFGESLDARVCVHAANGAEVTEQLAGRHLRVQCEVGGQVADPATNLNGITATVEAEERGPAT